MNISALWKTSTSKLKPWCRTRRTLSCNLSNQLEGTIIPFCPSASLTKVTPHDSRTSLTMPASSSMYSGVIQDRTPDCREAAQRSDKQVSSCTLKWTWKAAKEVAMPQTIGYVPIQTWIVPTTEGPARLEKQLSLLFGLKNGHLEAYVSSHQPQWECRGCLFDFWLVEPHHSRICSSLKINTICFWEWT